MAEILDCRAVARKFLDMAGRFIRELDSPPVLATVLYRPEAHAASVQYRDLILKDAATLGVEAKKVEPHSEAGLREAIADLNADPRITGIMVFYPLGSRFHDPDVMDLVSPRKDVEGLHSVNLGYLIKFKRFLDEDLGIKCVVPATAKAVVKTLQHYPAIKIEGAFAAIVNNSMRVGKPLGLMLENLGATVVKCYDKTSPAVLEESIRRADIVVTAVPDPAFRLDPAWIKPGAAAVDISYQGNIDFAGEVPEGPLFVTASDNRIGRVTRAMMFINLVYCARQKPLPAAAL